jgi:hypothetical protein
VVGRGQVRMMTAGDALDATAAAAGIEAGPAGGAAAAVAVANGVDAHAMIGRPARRTGAAASRARILANRSGDGTVRVASPEKRRRADDAPAWLAISR